MDPGRPLLRGEVTEDRGPLTPALAGPFRDALLAADFTYDAVAQLLELDPAATREHYLPEIASMVAEGYLDLV